MQRPERTFEQVEPEAAAFDVFDVETGNLVTSFDTPSEMREELPGVLSSAPDRRSDLMVFALDLKGHALGSWMAEEILTSA